MFKAIRAVFSLLPNHGLLLTANGLFGTLLGVRATIEGFAIGVIMAGHFIGLLMNVYRPQVFFMYTAGEFYKAVEGDKDKSDE